MGALTHISQKDRKSALLLFLLVNTALLGILLFGKDSATLSPSSTSALNDNTKEHGTPSSLLVNSQQHSKTDPVSPPSILLANNSLALSPGLLEDTVGPPSSSSSSSSFETTESMDDEQSSEEEPRSSFETTEPADDEQSSDEMPRSSLETTESIDGEQGSEENLSFKTGKSMDDEQGSEEYPRFETTEPLHDEQSWEENSRSTVKETKQPSKESPKKPSRIPAELVPKQKYITYLPHSGFHNQRIALENALVLAHLTERTLVVPPCYLGKATAWMPFDELYANLVEKDKSGLEFCSKSFSSLHEIDERCEDYMDYTAVSWKYLFDFDRLEPFVDLIHRDNIDDGWMEENLQATRADIYYVKDRGKYQYRIYDSLQSTPPLGKYNERINVDDLKRTTSRIIYFGSLFSSTRLALSTKVSKDFKKLVGDVLVYSNPKLIEAAELCTEKLGGAGTYIGMHLRTGDGRFRTAKEQSVRDAVEALDKELTRERDASGNKAAGKLAQVSSGRRPSLKECIRRHEKSSDSPVLFLATDATDPASDKTFAPLYARWPCIFTLNDLQPIFFPVISDEINDRDQVPLTRFLIPMLDTVLAAKSRFFIGTTSSTFSGYVNRLHAGYQRRSGISKSSNRSEKSGRFSKLSDSGKRS